MKQYSLAEARALLPQVVPVVEQLRDAYLELRTVHAAVASQARGASGDGQLLADPWDDSPENALEHLNQRIREAAARLEDWGVEVKDPERGLIDFVHERDGRLVYLCFHLGESDIGFWHELDAGFAGRQPL